MKIIGILFIISLVLLMVIPVGSSSNKTFIIGFRGDYIIHCLIYTPWMFVGQMMFGKRLKDLLWFIIGLFAVIVLEYIQILIPYRSFNINDLVAGLIGIGLSYGIMFIYRKLKRKQI